MEQVIIADGTEAHRLLGAATARDRATRTSAGSRPAPARAEATSCALGAGLGAQCAGPVQ
ncbi:hypothetical protein [Streptomyces sp. KL116D]|uniref:hypothetical protein n=1 Tax=Streptomyces sp. KL116D TaxID=3045152 RepID=UPI003557B2A0